MKILLLMCSIVLLTGCPEDKSKKLGKKRSGMDSPIIISDGSTRLNHLGFTLTSDKDENGNYEARFITSNLSYPLEVACNDDPYCPLPSNQAIKLVVPWKLVIKEDAKPIVTIRTPGTATGSDNSTIIIHYAKSLQIDPEPAASGVDLFQYNYKFNNAEIFNNFSPGSAVTNKITCGGKSPCRLQVHCVGAANGTCP